MNSRSAASCLLVITSCVSQAQGWQQFGRSAQHTALSSVPASPMEKVIWSATVTERSSNSGRAASPIITNANTVIMSVKFGTLSVRYEGRNGATGALVYTQTSDFIDLSGASCSCQAVITSDNKLVVPAAGGTLLVRDNADSASATTTRIAFYGVSNYNANPSGYSGLVIVSPLTADGQGNIYFGYRTSNSNPLGITTGYARVNLNGIGTWQTVSAATAGTSNAVSRDSALALSNDETKVYFGSADTATSTGEYLSMCDASTLANIRTAHLFVPGTTTPVPFTTNSACPMIGPDGDVYFGTWGHNGSEGYLHHYDSTLQTLKIPGAFGWDTTASLVPTTAVPSYAGNSAYLIATKYNHYNIGDNKVAILDPFVQSGINMQEIETVRGVTPDPGVGANAVVEWCINIIAVDPFTRSTMAHSEDGWIYRWDLAQNRLTERVQMSILIAEAYEPTVIGPDGTVYAVNFQKVFAIGPGPRTVPTSFSMARGSVISGGLSDVLAADDNRLVLRPGVVFSNSENPVQVVFESTSPTASPTSLKFTAESKGSTGVINQVIQLYNFSTNTYDTLDSFALQTSDGRMQVSATSPNQYVEAGTLKVMAKLGYKTTAAVFAYPWLVSIDTAYWSIEG